MEIVCDDSNSNSNNNDLIKPNPENLGPVEMPVHVPLPNTIANAVEFPYSGIFSPGGFLSTLSSSSCDVYQEEKENLSLLNQNQTVSSKERVTSTCSMDNLVVAVATVADLHEATLPSASASASGTSIKNETISHPPTNPIDADKAFVIAIDHILEKIFAASTTSDLLNYRLVSHRWNSFAVPQLQKRLTLNFYDYHLCSTRNPDGHGMSLRLLNNLMVRSASEFEFSFQFPCTKFNFTQTNRISKYLPFPGNLSDTLLESFLSTHGAGIEELTLNFSGTFDMYLPRESLVMSQVVNLLLFQTRNLRCLSLRLPFKVEWKHSDGRGARSALRTSDPEYNEINLIRNSSHSFTSQNQTNTKLQVLKFSDDVSAKILELVIQLAPNLQEIYLDPMYYSYLLEPCNRTHLLKKIVINPCNCDIDLLERIVGVGVGTGPGTVVGGSSEAYLRLREMCVRIGGRLHSDLEIRLAKVINRIFESCWNSLESIDWNGGTCLRGLKWNQSMPMPKIRKLQFGNPYEIQGQSLLPQGVSFAKLFPKLECIRFYDSENRVKFMDLLKYLNSDLEPVETVKTVHIINWNDGRISVEDSAILHQLFPCAQLAHQWV